MKKTIGILYESKFSESSFETGCGGSETWAIQLSKTFVKNGYHVIIFNANDEWNLTQSLVEYRPLSLFAYTCTHQHFDYFIFTRNIGQFYNILVENNCADHIYVQSHDMFIWCDGLYNHKYDWNKDRERFNKIEKFIALTEFHKEELHQHNNIPYEMISIIGNGLDSDVYNKVFEEYGKFTMNTQLKIDSNHIIFWTSAFGRGGDILVEDVFPLVKSQCEDAQVYICGYADLVPESIKNTEGVKFLGTVSKEEYYKIFFDADCWFLPCVVVEDFGICAAEALMCYCDIISTFEHGMKDVLYPFTGLKMNYEFGKATTDKYHYGTYDIDKTSLEYKKACNEAASMILESFRTHKTPEKKTFKEIARKTVLYIHTWQNVVDKWIALFNEK